MTTSIKPNDQRWAELLRQAVNTPGKLSEAYFAFHNYSMGNQIAAMFACLARGLPIGPIATYKKWIEQGRQVKRGEKAIALCMPVTMSKEREVTTPGGEVSKEKSTFARFIWRNNWFVLSQTEGDAPRHIAPPAWEKGTALTALNIGEVEFNHTDGNVQGFARDRVVAISPIAAHPFKTLFHEMGHILLGHTAESVLTDSEYTPRDLREAEAESVAMLCCDALGLSGVECSRGYIQSWYGHDDIPERSAQRIMACADKILKAGTGLLKNKAE